VPNPDADEGHPGVAEDEHGNAYWRAMNSSSSREPPANGCLSLLEFYLPPSGAGKTK
jgi:hypothetical protein